MDFDVRYKMSIGPYYFPITRDPAVTLEEWRSAIEQSDELEFCLPGREQDSSATMKPYGPGDVYYADPYSWDVFHLLTYDEGQPKVVYFDADEYPSIPFIETLISPVLLQIGAHLEVSLLPRDSAQDHEPISDSEIPF